MQNCRYTKPTAQCSGTCLFFSYNCFWDSSMEFCGIKVTDVSCYILVFSMTRPECVYLYPCWHLGCFWFFGSLNRTALDMFVRSRLFTCFTSHKRAKGMVLLYQQSVSSPGPTFSQPLVYLVSQIYFSRQKEMFPIWVGEIINVIQAKKGTLSYQAFTFEYILSFAFDMLYSYLSSQVLLRSRGPSNIFQRRKHRNWVRGKTSPSPSLMNHPRAPCPVSIGLILGLPQPYTFAAMMEKI